MSSRSREAPTVRVMAAGTRRRLKTGVTGSAVAGTGSGSLAGTTATIPLATASTANAAVRIGRRTVGQDRSVTAGYSGTPLPRKLGMKEGASVVLLDAPPGFVEDHLQPLPDGVEPSDRLRAGTDVVVLFVTERAELEAQWDAVAASLQPAGGFWVAWPKKSSKVPTDLTEDVLREVGLPKGWVDNKVCAVTDVWSGLRFVLRLENRPPIRPREQP
jgi:hypothetical protein